MLPHPKFPREEPMRTQLLSLAAVMLSTISAFAMSDSDLRASLEQRFKGDRTGACVAAAMIDDGTTASAYFCADPKSQRPYDEHTAFEIGSVTKTMTAALLAEFIARGEVTLNDPVAQAPAAMNETYIAKRPLQVRPAQGHLPNTMPQVPWDFLSTWLASEACVRRCPTWCATSKASLARARARSRRRWHRRNSKSPGSAAIRWV